MKEKIGALLKTYRELHSVSQRKLAEETGISFRQIQRIESGECDPSFETTLDILGYYGADIQLVLNEPNWDLLARMGWPVSLSASKGPKYEEPLTWKKGLREISRASIFIYLNSAERFMEREYDGMKALLFALKTHYPSRFKELKKTLGSDCLEWFELNKIRGRDIKLRNIALGTISRELPTGLNP